MVLGKKDLWEANSPPSLLDTVSRLCLRRLDILTEADEDEEGGGRRRLKADVFLPAEICENLIAAAAEEDLDVFSDSMVNIFRPGQANLRNIAIQNSFITDDSLRVLLSHRLREISLKNCPNLTVNSLTNLNKYSENLQSLELGPGVDILPDYMQLPGTFSDSDSDYERDGNIYEKQGYIIKAPNLQSLSVRDLYVREGSNYFELLLKPFPGLLRLDLSGTNRHHGFMNLSWLLFCKKLAYLNLHNVKNVEAGLESLCELVNLQHLDISQCKDSRGRFKQPLVFLQTLVKALPQLTSLDISGTNLSSGVHSEMGTSPLCDIAGLQTRMDNPFAFLGLYKTLDDGSSRKNLPARSITGDETEEQILLAGQLYVERSPVLENIINDMFELFRTDSFHNLRRGMVVLLNAMERHPKEKHIQISASASLYYIIKSEAIKSDLNVKVKKKIVSILLNSMFTHKWDQAMMLNGCLNLSLFQMPQDILFDYERLVKILLHIVSEEDRDNQRTSLILLNSLACQVEGAQRELLGALGMIEKLLVIVNDKLRQGICDEGMETAWSTMWNVTDETPSNCRRFLNGGGMDLFLLCKDKFPEKHDLLRNMLGLLGNVAEVPQLRPNLMTSEFVDEFAFLLDSKCDGIEVSYNAAGVLAHMASDGQKAWTIKEPERDRVLSRMVRNINRWPMDSKRNINYRSFEPIIRLLPVTETPECQLWAVWAIANLTKVSPGKYCTLVVEEGGLAAVDELLAAAEHPDPQLRTRPDVVHFAQQVRNNVNDWRESRLDG